jgi:hypothetical protein
MYVSTWKCPTWVDTPHKYLRMKGLIKKQTSPYKLRNLPIPEEYYFLGYNAVSSIESQPTFQRDISPPSSGSKNKLNKKPASPDCHLLSCRFLARLILQPWRRRRCVRLKCRLISNGLQGVISQKTVILITNAVRTSNTLQIPLHKF